MSQSEFKEIPINQITASSNYRKTFRDKTLAELAASIRANGVLEPIIVRPAGPKLYSIVAGERRYRGAKLAGLVTIPSVVRDVADADILKIQLIENVQREGVPYMEEAYAVKKLRDDLTLDIKEIARTVGKSEQYVYQMLRLCKMSDDARRIAENGWITKGVAWEIAKLPDEESQTRAANDLARTKRDKLITASGARRYIDTTFRDGKRRMTKERTKKFGKGSQYIANWKYYLVRFTADEFERFKKICRGRTDTEVIAEAVDLVMRRRDESDLANAMEA